MTSIEPAPVSYDVALMAEDMAAKGFMRTDLARKAGVSAMAVTRFMTGERRTARMAKKLAVALGYSVRRYLVSSRQAVA
jgi:transcriptional regulator with XRE-family HTH domain